VKDIYYGRSEVSNSDLSELKKWLYPSYGYHDPTMVYRFGNLIDCMITESYKVNYSMNTCDGILFLDADFERANIMRRSYFKDEFCRKLLEQCTPQKIMSNPNQEFETDGYKYFLPTRCKWDLWADSVKWGGDIKSTAATSQKGFEDAARHFDYDRQRYFYMNLAGSKQDVLIGISKVNFKIFKIFIKEGDDFYNSGKEKTLDLTFKYWQLFAS